MSMNKVSPEYKAQLLDVLNQQNKHIKEKNLPLEARAVNLFAILFCQKLDTNFSRCIELDDLKKYSPKETEATLKQWMLDAKPCGSPIDPITYVDMYYKFIVDPKSIPKSWGTIFATLDYQDTATRMAQAQKDLEDARNQATATQQQYTVPKVN
ncbi:hypothetical protein DFA_02292 [Cavenderia fasciculata]|uniref:Uncharacterized protein n=1 Tax=Cavenderia fasciculata TaxID=261658 RepID=F4PZ20_CACFS|nr:uncharacterized protein DFA_02292 [Cavenderia fasciculata]EGG19049.1 hypothetical protein DFA_02292 [Cavenderia fasciculata]|eukprot:XP_004366682.1 hypothetical protein DFA_02292 [Cavenderia fasciculata]